MGEKNSVLPILKNLDRVNHKKKLKLRYRQLKDRGYSLYLDIWHNNKREYEFLKLYVKGTNNSKDQDKETIQFAISIRDQKELEFIQSDSGIRLNNWKTNADFLDYFKAIADNKQKESSWRAVYLHIKKFTDGKLQFKEIDKKFCERFRDYLLGKISENTAYYYYKRFSSALFRAVHDEIIKTNPAKNIKMKKVESKREFLTTEEIKILIKTPCQSEEIKNAFLFSCFTGLRLGDIYLLDFDDISENYMYFKQEKTDCVERLKLNQNALNIIQIQKEKRKANGKVFHLPTKSYIRLMTKEWIKESGIKKNITFHSGRHTFATMCLTYDVDLFTVSKLLGHKDIKTTQIYAKLIDKKKDEAIDKLPNLLGLNNKRRQIKKLA